MGSVRSHPLLNVGDTPSQTVDSDLREPVRWSFRLPPGQSLVVAVSDRQKRAAINNNLLTERVIAKNPISSIQILQKNIRKYSLKQVLKQKHSFFGTFSRMRNSRERDSVTSFFRHTCSVLCEIMGYRA